MMDFGHIAHEITIGETFERRRADGSLEPLSDRQIADGAFVVNGRIFAPCVTWEKNFPGQVTLGRIGHPVIRFCPLDWHGTKRVERIKRRLKHMGRI